MNVNIKTNGTPINGQVVAFIDRKKIRIGTVVKDLKKPFYVLEVGTLDKYYPYTQDLIVTGDDSKIVEIRAKIEEI